MTAELSGNVHIVTGGKEMIQQVLETLSRTDTDIKGNPDIFIREYLQFGIDDARDVRERAALRAVKEGARVFIVVASQMTIDAQNALLKTLEEPSADAIFFVVVPTPETLLPTLRSRAQMLTLSKNAYEGEISAKDFLSASPSSRIEMLKLILPKEKDERDVGAIIAFLSSIERELARAGAEHSKAGLEAIYRTRKYITDKGSLLKPLLEQVALLAPRHIG